VLPASTVGELASGRKSPSAASTKRGSVYWLPAPWITPGESSGRKLDDLALQPPLPCESMFGAGGSIAPPEYYDQVGYSAIEHARNARRDGDRRPLVIRGGVLLAETAVLLDDRAAA
jgi:hypothetical protein